MIDESGVNLARDSSFNAVATLSSTLTHNGAECSASKAIDGDYTNTGSDDCYGLAHSIMDGIGPHW